MRRRSFVLGAAAIGAGTLAFGSRRSFAQKTSVKIVFPTPPTTLALPYYVARKQGWLDGIDIEEVYVNGDANSLRTLLSGNADVAIDGTFNVLTALTEGAKIKAISSWQGVNDYNVLVSPVINSLEQLSGKIFAATGPGGPPQELSKLLFQKHKIDVSTIRYVAVTGGHAGMLAAVLAGRADACLTNTVTAQQGVNTGKAKILTSLAVEYPKFGYVYNIVRAETVGDPKYARQYAALVSGGIRGSRFIMEHPDEAAAILHERVPEMAIPFLLVVIKSLNAAKVWGTGGGVEKNVVQDTIDTFRATGQLKSDLTVDQFVDYRFVDPVLKELAKT